MQTRPLRSLGVRLLFLMSVWSIFSVPTTVLLVARADDLSRQTEQRVKAKNKFSQIVAQQPISESRATEAKRLYQEGIQLYRNQRFNEALEIFQQALAIFREIENRGNIGATLNNIGLIYDQLNQPKEALDYYEEALENTPSSDLEGSGNTLYNIAVVYDKNHQYQQAFSYYQQALEIRRELKDRVGIGTALSNLGAVANNLGQYQQALTFYQQALTLYQEDNDQKNVREILLKMAVVRSNLAQNQQAIELLQEALMNSQNDREAGATLNKIGELYNNLGKYRQALNSLLQALESSKKAGDNITVGTILNNIGAVYTNLGQPERALEYLQQSLDFLQKTGGLKEVLLAINDLAIAYRRLNEPEKALELLKEALEISSKANDKARFGAILNNIGTVYYDNSQPQKALEFYQQALAVIQQVNNRSAVSTTLNNMGVVYNNDGQPKKALDFYQQALAIQKEINDRAGRKQTLYNMGVSYEKQKNIAQAIDSYRQAIEVTESIQDDIKIEELKATFANQQADIYSRFINLLWNQRDFETAFNYVERARARAFLDQLANGRVDFRAGADSKLLEQEQALKTQIVALSQQLITLRNRPKNEWDNETIAQIENKRTALQEDYQDLLVQLKIQSPETASLISVDVAPLTEIQNSLDADTTLVEYFVTDDRTLAFIITRNSFKTVPLNISREQLTEELTLFRDFADLDEPHPLALKNLHDWLIAPLQPHLNTTQLSIVPHGILHYLPFAALTDGNRYLSDDYALSSLPSASILRYLPEKRKSTTGSLLALGDPTIPGLSPLNSARQEVETIANLFNTQPKLGKAATESTVWSEATQSGIVHLAIHGEYNLHNPLFSAIHLVEDTENDGSLQVHEVYGLDLTNATTLVVLSACQTKIGELSRGDEVVGLNRAFLYAGTPTVMASLWNVDDAATGLLMKQFYTHWQGGMSKAEALQQAQKDVRETHPHPYYWAAFSLTGDARR